MESFATRLRSEIEYSGLLQKEVAFKAGIKKRALDMYLGVQNSMPPADVAVKIAKALDVSVEYLVTGEDNFHQNNREGIQHFKSENKEFEYLFEQMPNEIQLNIINLMKSVEKLSNEGFRKL